jgi:hypothetical protein
MSMRRASGMWSRWLRRRMTRVDWAKGNCRLAAIDDNKEQVVGVVGESGVCLGKIVAEIEV